MERAVAFAAELPEPGAVAARTWVQLLPAGRAEPKDGRASWRVADASAIVAASQPLVAKGMPVDFDHALERSGTAASDAPAAGRTRARARSSTPLRRSPPPSRSRRPRARRAAGGWPRRSPA